MKKITVRDNCFVNDSGDLFLAKGINMVCKDKSLGYLGNYTEKDFNWLSERGFNLIRLGIFWDACEPNPGEYNDVYLSEIEKIISLAAKEGISVFLDMHQDLFSSVFEDGAPAWATLTNGALYQKTELWSDAYLADDAVQNAFDNFWADAPASDGIGIKKHYVNLWKNLAKRFASNPNVIGYDIMNEPFPGSRGKEVAMILNDFLCGSEIADMPEEKLFSVIEKIMPNTSAFDTTVLQPFYEDVARAIRSVDSETIVMFEHNYFCNAGIPSALSPLMDASGRPVPFQAYVPHGYDILVDTKEYGEDAGLDRVNLIFGSILENANRLGLPTLIGEWGCYPNAGDVQKQQASHILSILNEANVGNVYYDFSHIYDGGISEIL